MEWPLIVSLVALVLTLNAWRPLHAPSYVAVVSFFAGWLTAELAIQHAVWQALLGAWLVYSGAIASAQTQAALVVFGASIVGLVLLHRRASLARDAVQNALRDGLG